ncbi:hypothetical protein BSKO_08456 [Bryopsis sp. KO-2023]|nr:hypothetical protein BSKO_08456 [Bryopsis sp. KO-2023]
MGDGWKLVAGKKGGALLLNMEEGFSFRRKRRGRQGQEYFACTNENCRATCILVSRDPLTVRISERGEEHNHPNDVDGSTVLDIHDTMKKRAVEETTSINKIFRDGRVEAVAHGVAEHLPNFPEASKRLYRARRSAMPPLPRSLRDVKIEGTH